MPMGSVPIDLIEDDMHFTRRPKAREQMMIHSRRRVELQFI
jgi:hypothetical protein